MTKKGKYAARPCDERERQRFARVNEMLREQPLSPPSYDDDTGHFDYSDRNREFAKLIAVLDNEFPLRDVA